MLFVFDEGDGNHCCEFVPDESSDKIILRGRFWFLDEAEGLVELPDQGDHVSRSLGHARYLTTGESVMFRLHNRLPSTGNSMRTVVASVRVSPFAKG